MSGRFFTCNQRSPSRISFCTMTAPITQVEFDKAGGLVDGAEHVRIEATPSRLFERHGDASDSHAQGRQAEDSSQPDTTHLQASASCRHLSHRLRGNGRWHALLATPVC